MGFLFSTVSKVFMVFLKNRILASTKNLLSSNTCAFRPNKNINEPILALKIYLQKCFRYKPPFIFTFIDYSKAFDTVKHDALWEALVECYVDQNIIKILKYYYNKSWARLQLGRTLSPYFRIRRGMKQNTMNLIDLSSNNYNINHLRIISYVDDLVLITKSRDETLDLLTSACFHSNKVGLTINFNKTFIMPSPEASIDNLTFEGNEIKIVNNFKYLGVLTDNKRNISGEIEARLKNAKITFMKYHKLWTARVSVKTRLLIFKPLQSSSTAATLGKYINTRQRKYRFS
ncbi:uncharacterized protein LOC135930754 [Gordionus sp. m RMFG-2023]|uniref:uncharacterized protein LOC135930754 n=1 Tax=Gordionus sp. m RMFG-2023 TaxID=3053472 RepID=UPI0031FC6491